MPTIRWRKSTYSDVGDCVEVAGIAPVVAVRDSKDPEGPRLALSAAEWTAFARRIKDGAHDSA
jgi:Domain of unknown function (DUF397)